MRDLSWSMRRLILTFVVAVAVGGGAPQSATAQEEVAATTVIDTQRFRPAGSFDSWVFLEGTNLGQAWQLDASLWVHAARRPMVFTLDGDPGDAAISGRVGAVVHAGFNIGRRVRLSLDMPMTIHQTGVDPVTSEELAAGGVGDLRLTPVVQILDPQKYWLGLALSAPVSFPTGNKDSYLGETGPTVHPRLSAEKRFSFTPRRWLNFSVGADLGWHFRPRTQLLDLDSSGELTFGFGFRWEPGEVVTIGTEVVAALGAGDNARHGEWLSWVRLSPGKQKNYRVLAGAAVGLGRGVGTPEARGYVAVQGTIGLKKVIEGGDAGAEDIEDAPTAVVESSRPPLPQPSRGQATGEWKLVLLKRAIRVPIQVSFGADSAAVMDQSLGALEEFATWLRSHPEAGIVQVRGHTGAEGDAARQEALSKARAEAVLAFLVKSGVDGKRLQATLMARQIQPKVQEGATPEEVAAASRRVDFKIVPEPPK